MVSAGDGRLWTSCGLFADFLRTKRGPRRTHDHEQRYPGRADTWSRYRPSGRGHPGRRSNAVSARPRASARGRHVPVLHAAGVQLGDQIGQRLRARPPLPGHQRLLDQGKGLSTSTIRSRTSTAARPDSAAGESSQARWRHEDEHHLGTDLVPGQLPAPLRRRAARPPGICLESERWPALGALSADGGRCSVRYASPRVPG
jgi:hypothetical protein